MARNWRGDKVAELQILFDEVTPQGRVSKVSATGEFYLANLDIEAIISYPWLKENQLGIFPHREALAYDHHDLTLLKSSVPVDRGQSNRRRGRRRRARRARKYQRMVTGTDKDLEEAEAWQDTIFEFRKMNLCLPSPDPVQPDPPLRSREIRYVAHLVHKFSKSRDEKLIAPPNSGGKG